MDRHPRPARHQPTAQEHIPYAEIQKTISLASVSGGGETQRCGDRGDGNDPPVYATAIGAKSTDYH